MSALKINTEKSIYRIEHHLHNREKWFGIAATPNGDIHVADRMTLLPDPFVFITGNDDFGDWVQILGSADTPVRSGMTKFDFHRFLVTTTSDINYYAFQMIDGEQADFAAKLADDDFFETPYISLSGQNDSGIEEFMNYPHDSGEKIWIRAACKDKNAENISAIFAIHEYPR
jgi:hypothetical protein